LSDEKKGDSKRVIRKPPNIAKVDDTVTVIRIDPSVQSKQLEDLKTGKVYRLIRTLKGFQLL